MVQTPEAYVKDDKLYVFSEYYSKPYVEILTF